MKKHEIIKTGYDKYPKGTRFKCIETKDEIVSNGNFIINGYNRLLHVNENNLGKGVVCKVIDCELKWAEIVKPKIAVRVENEKEFKALMRYYDSLGYKGMSEISYIFDERWVCVECADSFTKFNPDNYINRENYQIIPFAEFAEEHNIKLPLLTSEDGVDLYEGDRYFMFDYEKGTNGEFDDFRGKGFKASYFPLKSCEKQPAIFSTKHAALDWIEAQKPKRDFLTGGEVYFEITDECVWFYGKTKKEPHPVHFITKSDLKIINEKLKSLH